MSAQFENERRRRRELFARRQRLAQQEAKVRLVLPLHVDGGLRGLGVRHLLRRHLQRRQFVQRLAQALGLTERLLDLARLLRALGLLQ